ncbi:MAG: DNA translocase FtsK, partial [Muribaculaceae bacterium]|nr:DNA translocase FtsK [Muribaculaceae bacterium]
AKEATKATAPTIEAPEATQATTPATEPVMTVKTQYEIAQAEYGRIGSTYDPTAELSRFRTPVLDLLEDRPARTDIVDITEISDKKNQIIYALDKLNIGVAKIDATVGPTVTMYEIIPVEGVKIATIKRLEEDIAMALSAISTRIIAPIPGKGAIGIEVPNREPQPVAIRTILGSRKYQECDYELPLAVGATITNDVYIADLAKMPHLLVAGATGKGKSVGMNVIINSLIFKKHPAELKFVLIDPKKVEFYPYRKLEKHYLAKLPDEEDAIVTDMSKTLDTLKALVVEMEQRYDLLMKAEVVQITHYNKLFTERKLNPEKGHRFLPYIVVIIDEYADLYMNIGKEVETPVARIAQKARAVGIHMIIATQRPSANIITGVIRANFPARMAFQVSSRIDSKIILDNNGAASLIGKGDMLISHDSKLERVQCAFISTDEIKTVAAYVNNQVGYPHPYLLPPVEAPAAQGGAARGGVTGERDSLFNEIARDIVSSGIASTSGLQRRYSIGFARAGKIMDQLEAAGIVGPSVGGKMRDILVDTYRLEEILNS